LGESHGIILNISKTNVLILGQPNDLKNLDLGVLPKIKLGDEVLNICTTVKIWTLLGFFFVMGATCEKHFEDYNGQYLCFI
jgi:hypothetical protein